MSQPETSRELAALVRNSIQMDTSLGAIAREEKATKEAARLIEVYVAERRLEEATWWYRRKTWPNEEDSARLKQLRTERMRPQGGTPCSTES